MIRALYTAATGMEAQQLNIDAVAGLVELIEVSRGFEAYMQAMSRLDQVAERSITDVGRVG